MQGHPAAAVGVALKLRTFRESFVSPVPPFLTNSISVRSNLTGELLCGRASSGLVGARARREHELVFSLIYSPPLDCASLPPFPWPINLSGNWSFLESTFPFLSSAHLICPSCRENLFSSEGGGAKEGVHCFLDARSEKNHPRRRGSSTHPRMAVPPAPAAAVGAFGDHRLALSGPLFEDCYARLPPSAKDNFALINDLSALCRPLRWTDLLTPNQRDHYGWVNTPAVWDKYAPMFKAALETMPVLGISLQLGTGDRLEYVTVSSYNSYVATFPILLLAHRVTGWLRRGELLPVEIRQWLDDPDVTVLVVDGADDLQTRLDNIPCSRVRCCRDIFLLYQDKGVIHPTFSTNRPDSAWMMTYATGYHHCPTDEKRFAQLVGPHDYHQWPAHRQTSWRPWSSDRPNENEKFYFFFEAVTPFAFSFRLILHGILYGGMAAVDRNASLRDLFLGFLQGSAATRDETRARDPLGLTSDVPTGPPPAAPFPIHPPGASPATVAPFPSSAASMPVPPRTAPAPEATTALPSAMAAVAVTENKADAVPPKKVCLKPAPQCQVYSPQEPSDRVRHLADRDEGDALVLQDDALVVELNQDAGEIAQEPTQSHPPVAATSEQPSAAVGPASVALASDRPPSPQAGYFTRQGLERLRREQQQSERSRRPPSVEVMGEVRRVFFPQGGAESLTPATSGANAVPLGPIHPAQSPAPPRRPPDDWPLHYEQGARPKTGSGDTLAGRVGGRPEGAGVVIDLRQRIEAKGPTIYHDYDVRAHLDARAHAAAFKQGAANISPPLVAFPPGTSGFSQRIAARNRARPSVLDSLVSTGGPVNQQEKRRSNWNLTGAERAWNPFMEEPLFHRRCQACSSQHCSKFLADSKQTNCNKLREQLLFSPTRRVCDYRRCPNPYDHFTPVCPALHRRCPRCGCRGHGPEDQCDPRNETVLARFREDFEDQANVGFYTQHRFTNVVWGFYPHLPEASRVVNEAPVDYCLLSKKPVLLACALLESVLSSPDNASPPPPNLDENNAFQRAGNDRLAPSSIHQTGEIPASGVGPAGHLAARQMAVGTPPTAVRAEPETRAQRGGAGTGSGTQAGADVAGVRP